MDPSRLMTMPATITPRDIVAGVDEYNDEVVGDGAPVVLDGTVGNGVLLQQIQRSETAGRTDYDTWTLFLPPTVSFTASDKITVDGLDYEADGAPWPAFNPRLRKVTHIEATVKRIA